MDRSKLLKIMKSLNIGDSFPVDLFGRVQRTYLYKLAQRAGIKIKVSMLEKAAWRIE